MKKGIIYTDDYSNYVNDSTFVGILEEKISSKEELIKDYWVKFNCPHGGISWDSLDEILSDLEWINATRVLIVHKDLPKLDDENLRTYLEVLSDNSSFDPEIDVNKLSKEIGRKAFDGVIVVFPFKYEKKIREILNN